MICKIILDPNLLRYIITELLDTDLKRVIDKEHNKLTEDHFKLFLY